MNDIKQIITPDGIAHDIKDEQARASIANLMVKATYDSDDDGVVDNAEKVNNHTVESDVPANAQFTDTTYTAATSAPGKITSTSAVGTSTNYARQDHTHGIDLATGDNNGQIKIAGTNVSVKGLGSAAYTSSGAYAVRQELSNEDLNNVTTPGLYSSYGNNAVLHKPDGVDNFGLIVVRRAVEDYYTQILYTNTTVYRRVCEENIWSDWTQDAYTDTTYTASNGVTLTGTNFTNSGVRSIATGSANGTISVNTNGTTADVAVKGLGTASTKDVATSGNASASQVVMGNDTRLTDNRNAADVYAWAKASTKPSYTASEVGAIASTLKGANNGVAELDANGKVPSSQLPSYVDDVQEYTAKSSFPTTGEAGKIYVDASTNLTYRWSGTAYVEISPSLALGTTSSTAFRGDYGNSAYAHAVTNRGSAFASGLYKITTNSEGHVTAATAVVKGDITALGIPATDTNTWRGIQDNLTSSTNTTESLSAKQGYLLANGSARDNTKVAKSGDTMTGSLTMAGADFLLGTPSASSNDSADIVWRYGSNTEKMRLWSDDEFTAKHGPKFRVYSSDALLYEGRLPLADGTDATGTWAISVTGNATTATKANIATTTNAIAKYSDTSGTFADSNVRIEDNNLIIGTTDGSGTVIGAGSIIIGAKNDSYGILPSVNNWNSIGLSGRAWYRAYIMNYYGTNSFVANWQAGNNIGTTVSANADAVLGNVNFYNVCAAGGTQTKTNLTANSATNSNITITLPNSTGTLALTSSSITGNASTATKLATPRTIQTSLSSTSSASFDGSANITPGVTGTLGVGNGGTGQTTANAAGNALLSALPTWTATPTDDTYLVRRDTANTATFGQVKFSTVWDYISPKITKTFITGLGIPGSDTNTHRPIQMNGTEILGNNTTALNLKAGTNISLTNSSGTVTITSTDTNTWRGIQDNLTSSTNTTESLSAKQGYLLANGSARDSTKMPLSGGTFTGEVTFANGKQNTVGDDSAIGDFNVAGTLGLIGKNGATGLAFLQQGATWGSSANYAKFSYDGTTMSLSKPLSVSGAIMSATISATDEVASALVTADVGNITDLTIGNLIATGTARFTNGIYGRIIGTNDASAPAGALLQSGSGRADSSPTGDTWIYWDTLGGTSSYQGIRHNQGANTIGFYGGGTERVVISMGESKVTATTFAGNATTATTATALSSNAGSTSIPVYFSGGKPVAVTATSAAASGGTTLTLVTTGEKYTWNNKSNLAIGTTATTAAAGNHTHTLTIAADSGTNQLSLAANTKYKLTAGGSTYIFTTPADTNTWRSISDAVNSTSSDVSASSKAVKTAYDLAASKTANTGTVTSVVAGTGLTGGTITTSGTIALATSGVTAGSAGPTAAVNGTNGTTVAIPRITVDTYGRVTALTSYNLTNVNTDSDTKNTAGSTDTSSKIFLIGATSQTANPQTYSDNEIYATSGVLTTKSVQIGGTAATLSYNTNNKCIDFTFA